jgi:hypothetical protein
LALLAALLLSGCDAGSHWLKSPAPLETAWLHNWKSPTIDHGTGADRLARDIRAAIQGPGATITRLVVYSLPEPAPSVTIVTVTPATFLRDRLTRLFAGFGGHPHHLLLLDVFGRRVFESATTGRGGTTYVEPVYTGCSAFTDVGVRHHPCERGWPFGS